MSGEIAKLNTGIAGYRGLTPEELRDKLAELGRDDSESAHGLEDDLARAALTAIRDGHPNPAGLAREALIVLDADYEKWYA